jgi:hypothetical protein
LEEGIEVPSCNLVVKFDFPQTFSSYIQSKGMGRKKANQYILLVDEWDSDKEARYKEWLGVYKMSMRECHSRMKVQVEQYERDGEFYCTSEARVSGTQARVPLYQYLQKIPVDRFTRLTPAWTIQMSGKLRRTRSVRTSPICSLGWVPSLPTCWVPGQGPAATQDAHPQAGGGEGQGQEGVGQEVCSSGVYKAAV